MSRRCVGYEGEGRVRRPVYVDEGPATAAATSPMAMVERGGLPKRELGAPSGGAGPIERRFVQAAERDAREVARSSRYTRDELQERRQRGQAAMRAAIVAPTDEEEHAVSQPAPGPEPIDELPAGPLTDIAAAAIEAARRHERATAARLAAEAAETAYRDSLAALEAAWAGAGLPTPLVHPGPGAPAPVVATNEEPTSQNRVQTRRAKRGGQEDRERADRARRALEALARHKGDSRAAAAELGMRPNAFAMVVKHAKAAAA